MQGEAVLCHRQAAAETQALQRSPAGVIFAAAAAAEGRTISRIQHLVAATDIGTLAQCHTQQQLD